jgi:hypothetical protein
MCTLSIVSAELPAVERTFETVAFDESTGRQICSVVWTIGVDDVSATVFTTENGQMFPKTADTLGCSDGEIT